MRHYVRRVRRRRVPDELSDGIGLQPSPEERAAILASQIADATDDRDGLTVVFDLRQGRIRWMDPGEATRLCGQGLATLESIEPLQPWRSGWRFLIE